MALEELRPGLTAKYAALQRDLHFPEPDVFDGADRLVDAIVRYDYSPAYADHPWVGPWVRDVLLDLRSDLGWCQRSFSQTHTYEEPFLIGMDDDGLSRGEYSESGNAFNAKIERPGLDWWEEYVTTPEGEHVHVPAPPYTRSGVRGVGECWVPMQPDIDEKFQHRADEVARGDIATPYLLWWTLDALDFESGFPVDEGDFGISARRTSMEHYPITLCETPELKARAVVREVIALDISVSCDRCWHERFGKVSGKKRRAMLATIDQNALDERCSVLLVSAGMAQVMAVLCPSCRKRTEREGTGLLFLEVSCA
ncbi:hypothetical protein [Rhodococcus sp. NPDC127528]|uniref:hypothetical protein n=1 Tax=unclassified Rhodococcus (in: high G+C Gram-positive bacteria) TaxID=192944 RepID=UPI003635621E